MLPVLLGYREKDDPGLLDIIGDLNERFLKKVISGVAGDAVIPNATGFASNLGGVIGTSTIGFLIGGVASI